LLIRRGTHMHKGVVQQVEQAAIAEGNAVQLLILELKPRVATTARYSTKQVTTLMYRLAYEVISWV
jgi:hypothetical protein